MERKIDEVFSFDRWKLKVQISSSYSCSNCFFNKNNISCTKAKSVIGKCYGSGRSDKKNVIFIEATDNEGDTF